MEGSTVNTKYGMVRTDHILFIAAGAFHVSKPSDLIPELQGRFPIRVELRSLSAEDFVRILTEPKNALVRQFQHMFRIEGSELEFTECALLEIANLALKRETGARALRAVLDELMLDKMYDLPDLEHEGITFVIDGEAVRNGTPLHELPIQQKKESA